MGVDGRESEVQGTYDKYDDQFSEDEPREISLSNILPLISKKSPETSPIVMLSVLIRAQHPTRIPDGVLAALNQ